MGRVKGEKCIILPSASEGAGAAELRRAGFCRRSATLTTGLRTSSPRPMQPSPSLSSPSPASASVMPLVAVPGLRASSSVSSVVCREEQTQWGLLTLKNTSTYDLIRRNLKDSNQLLLVLAPMTGDPSSSQVKDYLSRGEQLSTRVKLFFGLRNVLGLCSIGNNGS